ncbi:hypothetical protein F0919_00765 [Taibaiella lutea]|uniref:Uncharacterized protein n=1 Tax=Taibaiella lutea TaxID=2608001 RepID=A0A5M6CPA5_9BACT|nr:hypothetical protein [Taibaiella lutea]KAA5536230.1 hypothetical protein F0919_00765 [Taibaiella lutea]
MRINNSYFAIRVQLINLENNEKLEYRSLYSHLHKIGLREYFFDEHDNEIKLPEGMYAILSYNYTGESILRKTADAIEEALKEFYPNSWSNKFTLMISGPGTIYYEHLEHENSEKKSNHK